MMKLLLCVALLLGSTTTTFVKSHESIVQQLLVCNKSVSHEGCLVEWNNFVENIFRKEYFIWKAGKDTGVNELLRKVAKEAEDSVKLIKLLHEYGDSNSVRFKTTAGTSHGMIDNTNALMKWQKDGSSPTLPTNTSTYFEAPQRAVVLLLEDLERQVMREKFPATFELQHAFNREFGVESSIHIYESGPAAYLETAHEDPYDVVIAQLKGHKVWKLCPPRIDAGASTSPLYEFPEFLRNSEFHNVSAGVLSSVSYYNTENINSSARDDVLASFKNDKENGVECDTHILYPGDRLYVPQGMVHYPYTTAEEGSVHVTIGLRQWEASWEAMLFEFLERLYGDVFEEVEFDVEEWFSDMTWVNKKEVALARSDWSSLIYPLNPKTSCDALASTLATKLSKWNISQNLNLILPSTIPKISKSLFLNTTIICDVASKMMNHESDLNVGIIRKRRVTTKCYKQCMCKGGCDSKHFSCDHTCTCNNGFAGGVIEDNNCRCVAGYVLKGTVCTKCTAGYYKSTATTCTMCPAGQYQWKEAQNACVMCVAGQYQNQPGQTRCIQCPTGQIQPKNAQRSCSSCAAGFYAEQRKICKLKTECSPKEFISVNSTLVSNRKCNSTKICTAGTYVSREASLYTDRECSNCAIDTYNTPNKTNQPSCFNKSFCGAGQFMSDEGNSTQDITCKSCAGGYYMELDEHRAQNCTLHDRCPAGYKHSNTTMSNISCIPCERNTYMDISDHNNTSCKHMTTCSHGMKLFENELEAGTGPGICISCTLGYMNLSNHQEHACFPYTNLNCKAGEYLKQTKRKDSTCVPCPINTTQPNKNHQQKECSPIYTKCGHNEYMELLGNSTMQTVCKNIVLNCAAGQYLDTTVSALGTQVGVECLPCPPGTFIEALQHSSRTCERQPHCAHDETLVGNTSITQGWCKPPTTTTTSLTTATTSISTLSLTSFSTTANENADPKKEQSDESQNSDFDYLKLVIGIAGALALICCVLSIYSYLRQSKSKNKEPVHINRAFEPNADYEEQPEHSYEAIDYSKVQEKTVAEYNGSITNADTYSGADPIQHYEDPPIKISAGLGSYDIAEGLGSYDENSDKKEGTYSGYIAISGTSEVMDAYEPMQQPKQVNTLQKDQRVLRAARAPPPADTKKNIYANEEVIKSNYSEDAVFLAKDKTKSNWAIPLTGSVDQNC
eukprot:m.278898 g.278898  ORF g.278898 m.278898 type:complete len:1181 (+) comp16319_c0_seq11:247-3789(+)